MKYDVNESLVFSLWKFDKTYFFPTDTVYFFHNLNTRYYQNIDATNFLILFK